MKAAGLPQDPLAKNPYCMKVIAMHNRDVVDEKTAAELHKMGLCSGSNGDASQQSPLDHPPHQVTAPVMDQKVQDELVEKARSLQAEIARPLRKLQHLDENEVKTQPAPKVARVTPVKVEVVEVESGEETVTPTEHEVTPPALPKAPMTPFEQFLTYPAGVNGAVVDPPATNTQEVFNNEAAEESKDDKKLKKVRAEPAQRGEDLLHEVEAEKVTPPVYSEQGQQRGRKPKNGTKGKKAKGKKAKRVQKSKKPKLNKAAKNRAVLARSMSSEALDLVEPAEPSRKRKAKVKKTVSAEKGGKSEVEGAEPSASSPVPKRRCRKDAKPKNQEPRDPEKAKQSEITPPDDAIIAPEHCTCHGVYSSAYKKAKALGLSVDEQKERGKQASQLLRDLGLISPGLSGHPRAPRAKKLEATS